MSKKLTWRDVSAQLRDPRFASRPLSSLYLDQSFMAGNGHYLRSEIIHDAGLPHSTSPDSLSRGVVGRLARSTLSISERSYDTGGITLAPRLSRRLEVLGLPRVRRRFYVFGREGYPCYRCGATIVREEVGGRRLYFCPKCRGHD